MRFFLLFLLFFTLLEASSRPKIALVLSGGGARGAAHVGVLKVLEKNHIPIDMIVGTSMGSFMGGLYASGKSPDEIKKILLSTNWQDVIRTDFEREKIPMQKKLAQYRYQGKLGVGVNDKNQVVLPTGVLKREPLLLAFDSFFSDVKYVNDFDKLRIPFRAVATNIENGEAVVLKSGSVAEAVYASSAIPGGLQPISINGVNLIDGGVSKNIPIEVAKEMGADIIIAVDVSEPFEKDIDVNSYFVVMGQLVNIMMRKNANESIKLLTQKDVLIIPDLKGYTGLDVEKYAQIIEKGYDAALKQESQLQRLALPQDEYVAYVEAHKNRIDTKKRVIDAIEIDNHTYLANKVIRKYIHQKEGSYFDDKQLREDIMQLYNTTLFDSIDYKIISKNKKNILLIKTTSSWNSRGDIFFSLSLEDNFKSQNNYSLKLGYWLYGINSLGAEWRNDVEVGSRRYVHSEFYQPLDEMQYLYVKPYLLYEDLTYTLPTDIGNQELDTKRYGGGFGLGANLSATFNIEAFLHLYRDQSTIDILSYNEKFLSKEAGLKIKYDSLDNYNFAQTGLLASMRFSKELVAFGADYDYNQLYATIQKPFSYKDNTFIFNAKLGLTNVLSEQKSPYSVYDKFSLGGMFNLSGYQSYTLVDN
ncbi:MAG: patatin-like phospholipase family protein, partial [Sulfurimonas sp.]